MRSIALASVALLGFGLQPNTETWAANTWHVRTVDSEGDVGWDTSIAVDAGGRPHISYHDYSSATLKYAARDGADWITETADTDFDLGHYSSLALDSGGRPHVSYYDAWNGTLKYAARNGGWITQTVDDAFDVGYGTSLAIDPATGFPRISYRDDENGILNYAAWTGTAWAIEDVDTSSDTGYTSALALDGAGLPHIGYYDWTSGVLRYARWTGTEWLTETVDAADDVGSDTSIAIDAGGRPHISYYDYTNGNLKYAAWTGGIWAIQTVDGGSDVGGYTSLALDGAGYPHISYTDLAGGALKYAAWTGSAWAIETVDGAGDVGYFTSLALDAAGHPHISYYDNLNWDLKYATTQPPAWHDLPTAGLCMISFPYAPASATVHELLCDDYGHVPGNYHAWRWDPLTGSYVGPITPPDCATHTVSATQGLWLLAEAGTIDAEGAMPAGPQAIPLAVGWNMIRIPYLVTVDSLQVEHDATVNSLAAAQSANWMWGTFWYSHDGTGEYQMSTLDQTPADQLLPWYGYWALALVDCTLIVDQPSTGTASASSARAPVPPIAWAFDIHVASEGASDAITIAAAEGASDAFDGLALDAPKAPASPASARPRVALSPGWLGGPGPAAPLRELSMETRSAVSDAEEWHFTVTGGSEGQTVTLSWPDLSSLPRDRSAILTDHNAGRRTFLRTRAQYGFGAPGARTSRSFTLAIKHSRHIAPLITTFAAIPLRGAPGAEIVFDLSADASADISILNVAGRLVQRVRNGMPVEAGRHTVTWTGRSLNDTVLPNGLYMCRVRAKTPDGRQAQAIRPITLRR